MLAYRFLLPLVSAVIFSSVIVVLFPSNLFAQSPLPTQSRLEVTPRSPEPESAVTITLNAYSIDTNGASIYWYVDGNEIGAARNERQITINSAKIGGSKTVRVVIEKNNTTILSLTETIQSSSIALIIESDSYTPSFYKGRALPSSDTPIRVIALPSNGRNFDPVSLTYLWQLNGKVLFGGPVKGKRVAELTMPRYSGNQLVVTVTDSRDNLIGSKSISLTPVDPELYFYTQNPLFGVSLKAAGANFTLISDEVTLLGEPYFIQTDDTFSNTDISWKLNGSTIKTGSIPNALTLRREGGEGRAEVEVRIISKYGIPLILNNTMGLYF